MNKVLQFAIAIIFFLSCSKNDEATPSENPELYFPPTNSDTWETTYPESLGWNTSEIPALSELLEDNGTRAFIVLVDGKIVLEEYFGNNLLGNAHFDEDTYWYWASAGKTLTATMVGKAQEDGFLSIDDKTSDYLGDGWTSMTPDQEDKITIRHQLTMTSGLDDGVPNNHSFEPSDLIYKADPGTRWAYHNAPYTLLESVVSNSVSEDFDSYFNKDLRDKIGMDGAWQWIDNDHVYFSSARTMARFGLLILNNGDWNGTQILTDKSYLSEMITTSQDINLSYGYLWWLSGKNSFMLPELQIEFPGSVTPDAPDDMVSGVGKNGQYVCVVPSMNLVLVRMGENADNVSVPILFINDIWKQMIKIMP